MELIIEHSINLNKAGVDANVDTRNGPWYHLNFADTDAWCEWCN